MLGMDESGNKDFWIDGGQKDSRVGKVGEQEVMGQGGRVELSEDVVEWDGPKMLADNG